MWRNVIAMNEEEKEIFWTGGNREPDETNFYEFPFVENIHTFQI